MKNIKIVNQELEKTEFVPINKALWIFWCLVPLVGAIVAIVLAIINKRVKGFLANVILINLVGTILAVIARQIGGPILLLIVYIIFVIFQIYVLIYLYNNLNLLNLKNKMKAGFTISEDSDINLFYRDQVLKEIELIEEPFWLVFKV